MGLPICEEVTGPVHTHDCEDCVYLGTTKDDGKHIDHYWCEQSALDMPTLIQRFSSNGCDYSNLPVSMARWDSIKGQALFQTTYDFAYNKGLCK